MQKNFSLKLGLRSVVASALMLVSASSMAASTWNLDTCTNQNNVGGASGLGNTYYCAGTAAGNGVTVSAFGNNSGSTAYSTAFLKQNGSGSGFGVGSQAEGGNGVQYPEHTMDNNPGGQADLILLKFDTAVALDSVTVGWYTSDADITVMAYNGTLTGANDAAKAANLIGGKTSANLTASGTWGLIKNVGDGGADVAVGDTASPDLTRSIGNSGNVVSSWWLIAAYNSGFGGTGIASPDSLKDMVKLMTVASKDVPPPPGGNTPEPASLALTSLALLGAFGARRRQLRKQA
jgi:hypothetical protein